MDMRIKDNFLILARKLRNGTIAFPSEHKQKSIRNCSVPLPFEQYNFLFQKVAQKWNGTIAFPCEQGLTLDHLKLIIDSVLNGKKIF